MRFERDRITFTMNEDSHPGRIMIELFATPEADDIEAIVQVFEAEKSQVDSQVVMWIEHVGIIGLRLPSMDEFQIYAQALQKFESFTRDHVLCTVVVTQKLDALARLGKDIFLGIYQPVKPLGVVEGRSEAIEFVSCYADASVF